MPDYIISALQPEWQPLKNRFFIKRIYTKQKQPAAAAPNNKMMTF